MSDIYIEEKLFHKDGAIWKEGDRLLDGISQHQFEYLWNGHKFVFVDEETVVIHGEVREDISFIEIRLCGR